MCPLEMAAILQSEGQGQRASWLDKESLNSVLILCQDPSAATVPRETRSWPAHPFSSSPLMAEITDSPKAWHGPGS